MKQKEYLKALETIRITTEEEMIVETTMMETTTLRCTDGNPTCNPDPVLDPVRCGIAYLMPKPTNVDGDSSDSADNHPNSTTGQFPIEPPKLRLCDPDWVLGGDVPREYSTVYAELYNVFHVSGMGR